MLFILLSKALQYFLNLPEFIYWISRDLAWYIRCKYWTVFDMWGLHIFVARFGGGKTSTMVAEAFDLACKYPQLTILTNLKLSNFPAATRILKLTTVNDILKAPKNCLVLIDEIGTLFNSRDFKAGTSLPKILFQYLCQCRHRHMMIYGTCQRWHFLDKQLRDIATTVRVCNIHFRHPFSRICTVTTFDAPDYELAYANPMVQCNPMGVKVVVQSDEIRALYDTEEMVDTMLTMEYDTDEEILANQGFGGANVGSPADKKAVKQVRKGYSGIR